MMTIIAAVAMLAAGCGGGEKKAAEKVLRVGTEPTFAPFEFQKEGSSEFTGFDMDLIRAIGKQAGYKVEIQNMGFDALIPALNAGNIDVTIAGMSITEERKGAVAFADPYYTSGLIVMVNKDNNEIKSIEDLKGKRIACQIGTTGEMKSRSVEGAKVVAFNTNTEAVHSEHTDTVNSHKHFLHPLFYFIFHYTTTKQFCKLLFSNTAFRVEMHKNLFICASLTCHIIGTVLTHSDTVTLAVNRKNIFFLLLFYGEIRTVQLKCGAKLLSAIFLAENKNLFYKFTVGALGDFNGFTIAFSFSKRTDFLLGESFFSYIVRRKSVTR